MPRDEWQKAPYSAADIEAAVHLRKLDCGTEALRFELAKDYLALSPSQFASIVKKVQYDLSEENSRSTDDNLPLLNITYDGDSVDSIDLMVSTFVGYFPVPIFDVDSAQDTVDHRRCD